MLKIGVFAGIAQVSIKCLHHYDDIGLLRPVEVDRDNGYRYYTVEQLPRLHRILALKDLGFSLDEIALLIDAALSNTQLREMLEQQQSEVEQRVREEQERLSRLTAHLKLLQDREEAPLYDVILKRVPSQLVASLPISYQQKGQIPLIQRFDETRTYLKGQHASQTGPEFSLWYDRNDNHDNLRVEAVFPIESPVTPSRRVQVYEMSGTLMATTMHKGPHRTTHQAVAATLQWIEANGYRINGPNRHLYHLCDKTGTADSVVEVQFPVVKTTKRRKTQ